MREYFSDLLVQSGTIRTQLIQRTERATDNRIYLIHQKEHSAITKTLIKNLDTKLATIFSEEALSTSKGEYTATSKGTDTFSTPATKKECSAPQNLLWGPNTGPKHPAPAQVLPAETDPSAIST